MIVNKALYPVSTTIKTISNMQKQMEHLQMQLATGKRYNSLAEIGSDRIHDLNIRSRLGRITGYQANIQTVETRLSFYSTAMKRLDDIEASARALAVPGAYGTDGINLANSKNQAQTLLKEVIDTLNTDIMGQYIFGGNASDRKPVASFDEMMYGSNGFQSFTQQRHGEDLANSGRLDRAVAANTVTLTEDGDHEFGFKLAGGSSSNPGITVTLAPVDLLDPDGPQQVDVAFGVQPTAGQEVTILVTYPDDRTRTETITLRATTEVPPPAGTFLIGGNADATATSFSTALGDRLTKLTETKLTAASTYAAADQFFTKRGETQHPDAMQWYNGQDVGAAGNPRQTVSANIDDSTKVSYGVQGNENGIAELMKGLAVFAVSELTPLDSTNAGIYDGLVSLQRARLSDANNAQPGSIEVITMELGLAANTLDTVKSRHQQYNADLQSMLSGIETAPLEEVAMQMLTLRTRLEASYQVTSMVSQLTLVNYLR
jgi:flagellar hook-associated protein 3 FlgL